MSDVTRPPGENTAAAPDARGESALGTGHGTTPRTARTETDRTDTARTDTARTETARGDALGTGAGAERATGTNALSTEKGTSAGARAHLFPHDETDKLGLQLQHAVAGFVDGPRASVEEADHVLEEIAARFTEAVAQRRRTLRHSWQSVESGEGKPVSSADTEQLRLALKDYRELAERLLHV
ncbi:hypothetical protein GCM10010313_56250 [Streptomyces violarus]|uniref:Uncharacterized protein n=1 Tax=Streptomyces violarus TaxID=67380 RepID=A0A7W5F1P9_9ACTN|nr:MULTISPECIES: hypothetical protein [Streptomyces]MBB3076771.1 hypothetical protein [Streptomyces violarus]WRU01561.1 hypothetical protein VJ737_29515 [Streptomyces sp. CGMCC 4.1772]GHD21984.1 hypothetical protein GCM10010313_56250 [Streptomyces violarus]